MKKYVAILSFLICSMSYGQEVCQSFEYQEMKEMETQELLKEFCTSMHAAVQNAAHAVHAHYKGKVHSIVSSYGAASDKCKNQADRVRRVLSSKGVDNVSYDTSCEGY